MLQSSSAAAGHQTQSTQKKVVRRRVQTNSQDDQPRNIKAVTPVSSINSVAESTAEFASPNQAVILFDWDDTLCPTHWIRDKFPSLLKAAPDEDWAQNPLRELEAEVKKLLEESLEVGRVVIVTNALEPWVTTSCKNFFPGLLPIVENIQVMYARSIYTSYGIDSPQSRPQLNDRLVESGFREGAAPLNSFEAPRLWKENAFHLALNELHSEYEQQSWKNIICIGDSPVEHQAVRKVIAQRPNRNRRCFTKTIKFLQEPSIQELIAQVKMMQGALPRMITYDGQLDIEIDEDDVREDLVERKIARCASHRTIPFEWDDDDDDDNSDSEELAKTSSPADNWLKMGISVVYFRTAGKMMMTFCQGWEGA